MFFSGRQGIAVLGRFVRYQWVAWTDLAPLVKLNCN